MDLVKIGKFLAKLRAEQHLTQERLGEQIGVSNKTISRWETGNYLPPVEMLILLSKKYDISINEILSGERLEEHDFKLAAENNVKECLKQSVFTLNERICFYQKKWRKEHRIYHIIFFLIFAIACIVGVVYAPIICIISSLALITFYLISYNRMCAYVENRAFNNPSKNE